MNHRHRRGRRERFEYGIEHDFPVGGRPQCRLDTGKSPKSLSRSVLAKALRSAFSCVSCCTSARSSTSQSLSGDLVYWFAGFCITSSCFTKELKFIVVDHRPQFVKFMARQRDAPMRIWKTLPPCNPGRSDFLVKSIELRTPQGPEQMVPLAPRQSSPGG